MSQKVPLSAILAVRDLAYKTKGDLRKQTEDIATQQGILRTLVEKRDATFEKLDELADYLNDVDRDSYPGLDGWRSVLGVNPSHE